MTLNLMQIFNEPINYTITIIHFALYSYSVAQSAPIPQPIAKKFGQILPGLLEPRILSLVNTIATTALDDFLRHQVIINPGTRYAKQ